jgi:hypothetical protein
MSRSFDERGWRPGMDAALLTGRIGVEVEGALGMPVWQGIWRVFT